MISFNQHVLVGQGAAEDTWLNEGLSHFAEELGGRLIPDTECQPAFATARASSSRETWSIPMPFWIRWDLKFLIEPGNSNGTLAERGGNWLFVRWLADHFASTQPTGTELTRALVQTSRHRERQRRSRHRGEFFHAGRPMAVGQLSGRSSGFHSGQRSAPVLQHQFPLALSVALRRRRGGQAIPPHPRRRRCRHRTPARARSTPARGATSASCSSRSMVR